MTNLVPIGRFSAICRLSQKALRLYDAGREVPGGRAAYTLFVGAYDGIGPAYAALQGWMQAHGHEGAGAPREIYLVGAQQARTQAELRTEIQWPIR